MAKRKIYAREFINNFDFLHLAREFYRYIFRFPDLEPDTKWKNVKNVAEDFIVMERCKQENSSDFSPKDFREFLRFYTSLEAKHYDEDREFIFTDKAIDLGEVFWLCHQSPSLILSCI